MAKGKNVLTTGDVAKICNVAPRTVSKWFDRGQLKGYRIPGSKDRRIPFGELIRFMRVHNMPTDGLPAGKIRVLVVDSDREAADRLAARIGSRADYEIKTAHSNFEAGAELQRFSPHVLLVKLMAREIDATGICSNIRGDEELQTIKVIAVSEQLSDSESKALIGKGFDGCVRNGEDPGPIIGKIEDAVAIIY